MPTCAPSMAERQEWVTIDDRPHGPEHSIEVQLPFLQRVLADGWTCVPLAVGVTAPEQVADVLDGLCVNGDTLPVVSTDLSHYLDQPSAQDAIGIRHRQSWTGMPPRSMRTTRAVRSPFAALCTGHAGMSSRSGCCAWAPLPTLAETLDAWSVTPRLRSSRRWASGRGERRRAPSTHPLSTASPGGSIGLEMATDVQVILDDQPGELARLGEAAGAGGVNIQGLAAFTGDGKGVVHVLVDDDDLARLRLALDGRRDGDRG